MQVPYLDLKAQYQSIKEEIQQAITPVLEQTAFAGGPFVAKFEEEFAAYCNSNYAVGVGNGTEALWLALIALDIGPGDEVITAANTFIATAEAISIAGAKPVLVDIDPESHNIDPARIEAAITPKTRAIIPVHLFGQMAYMDAVINVAKAHDLHVIEDASQAHGARYKGKAAGSMGKIGCFSLYPGKNLGAYGEAGVIVTQDEKLANKMRMFRDHGQSAKYHHQIIGWNARMDGIQGAVLSVKMRHIENWTEARRQHASRYDRLLAGVDDITTPAELPEHRHVYHIYAVRTQNRDMVLEQLKAEGIFCGIHYPIPVHLQPAYRELGHAVGDFPIAEQCAREYLSLPMFAELQPVQVEYVAKTLKQVVQKTSSEAFAV